jgi:hypothetical protein
MRLLEITVGWTQLNPILFSTIHSIRNVSKYQVAQVDISNHKVKCQTLRIVR